MPLRRRRASFGFGGGGGARGVRGWTITTWLIVICVGVFVVDYFLPRMMAPIQAVPVRRTGLARCFRRGRRSNTSIAARYAFPVWASSTARPIWPGVGWNYGRPSCRREPWPRTCRPASWCRRDVRSTIAPRWPWAPRRSGTRRPVTRRRRMCGCSNRFGWPAHSGSWATSRRPRALITLDAYVGVRGFEFWRFISFQFLHADQYLLFNMIGLWCSVEWSKYLGRAVSGVLPAVRHHGRRRIPSAQPRDGRCSASPEEPAGPAGERSGDTAGGASASLGIVMARVLVRTRSCCSSSTDAGGDPGLRTGGRGPALGVLRDPNEERPLVGAVAGYWPSGPDMPHGFFDFSAIRPTSRSAAYRAGDSGPPAWPTPRPIELAKIHSDGLQSLTTREKRLLRGVEAVSGSASSPASWHDHGPLRFRVEAGPATTRLTVETPRVVSHAGVHAGGDGGGDERCCRPGSGDRADHPEQRLPPDDPAGHRLIERYGGTHGSMLTARSSPIRGIRPSPCRTSTPSTTTGSRSDPSWTAKVHLGPESMRVQNAIGADIMAFDDCPPSPDARR